MFLIKSGHKINIFISIVFIFTMAFSPLFSVITAFADDDNSLSGSSSSSESSSSSSSTSSAVSQTSVSLSNTNNNDNHSDDNDIPPVVPTTPPAPININIVASKIVCDSESDLPNWGLGGPDITANTASEFLSSHQNCHLASDWNFQWANSTASDPGTSFVGEASGWNTFGPTNSQGVATVAISVPATTPYIWVREVLKNDYLSFTYPDNSNSHSAEMYCRTDVLNYDNYDRINSPFTSGSTYYCVAFNALKSTPSVNTPPKITLVGSSTINLTLGQTFTDPGATATDTEDGDLTSQIIRTGTVDASTTGTYILTYSVTDSGGLSASTTRTVIIKPVVCESNCGGGNPPTIDLSCKITSPDQTGWYGTYYNYSSTTLGMNLPTSEWNTSYGAPLSSNASSSEWYTSPFARFSRVDGSLSFGNNFFPFDSASEEIINGHDYHFGVHWSAKVTATTTGEYGFTLTSDDDAWVYVNGKLVADNSGVHSAKTITATTTLASGVNSVDIFFAERHITESVMNFAFKNTNLLIKPYSPICNPVPVNTPPVITLIGSNPLNLTVGTLFADPGATATDTEDGDLTAQIIRTGTVDASTTGTYILTYVVKDSGNLYATTTRTVVVNPIVCTNNCGPVNTPPIITLIGGNPLNLTIGDTFTDPGATATDTEDGDLTSQIIRTGTVDASTTGTYILTYSVTDSGGLSASTTRTVIISEKIIPPVNPPINNGGGGGGGGIGGHRHPVVVGEILGATSCLYLRDHLKIGWNNDPIEVLKLQSFLNVFEKENLSLTGKFDQTTFEAVERFQTKYSGDILNPWGPKVTTGFVYILTKKKVNEIYCNSLFPVSQIEQNEINAFRLSSPSNGSNGGNNPEVFGQSTENISLGNNNLKTADVPIVNLTSSSSNGSVVKNAAISLFALPQKMFGGFFNNYSFTPILVLLILIAAIIAVARLFMGSKDSENVPTMPIVTKAEDEKDEEESSTIILPGVNSGKNKKDIPQIFHDEEIVIENSEEEI